MENIENIENPQAVELQKMIQKLEKLEKMINPNSKKSLILWEEDDAFKSLISTIKEYATDCSVEEFPVELFDRLKALKVDAEKQVEDGTEKITELKRQAKVNLELSETLSLIYIAAMAGSSMDEYSEKLAIPELDAVREQLCTLATVSPDSDEYIKAEKVIKSKINNLENSVHITIDLERTTSKDSALEYIKAELTPAIERLQSEYDAKVASEEAEDVITALAIRKTFAEKVYDAIVRPFANLFKRKQKVK